MSLPVEILQYILDFLKSDTATLKVCSKSHPMLSQLVERHLYTDLVFQDFDGPDELCEGLRDRPHVTNYVHTLEIKFARYSRDPEAFLEEISLILPTLSKLKTIRLRNTGYDTFSWAMVPMKFRLAFLDCLCLQSLTDVFIESVAFPLSVLKHCKHIEHLSLRNWDNDGKLMAGDENACPPTINSLALYDCRERSLSTIVSWIPARHLSSLTFSPNYTLHGLPIILRACSHSLCSLNVNIGAKYRSYYNFSTGMARHSNNSIPIFLSVLPNLQQLIIGAQLDHAPDIVGNYIGKGGFHSPVPAVARILNLTSSLKRLTLDFCFYINPFYLQYDQDHITDVFCSALYSLLVQSVSVIDSINLRINSSPVPNSVSSDAILSMFACHSDVMQFVESGKLILTPVDASTS